MIDLLSFSNYWRSMKDRIPSLQSVHIIANEAQLKDILLLPSNTFPTLLVSIPSSSPINLDSDNIVEINSSILFVLTKVAASDRTSDSIITQLSALQIIVSDIKRFMVDDYVDSRSLGHHIMNRLVINSFSQDPEYNYLGCDGWSMAFKFSSVGY